MSSGDVLGWVLGSIGFYGAYLLGSVHPPGDVTAGAAARPGATEEER